MIYLILIPMIVGPVLAIAAVLYICLVMIPGDERREVRRKHLDRARYYLNIGRRDLARAELSHAERLF